MFIKRVKTRGITYLQLVEGYWENGRSKHRLLKSLGREDQLDPKMIDRFRASLKQFGTMDQGALATLDMATLGMDQVTVSTGRRVGSLLPLQALWRELEFDRILSHLAKNRRFQFDVVNVIKAIVYQRILDRSRQ